MKKEDLSKIFNSDDPKSSKIYLDYHLFDSLKDNYNSSYINNNCIQLFSFKMTDFSDNMNSSYNQTAYDNYEIQAG